MVRVNGKEMVVGSWFTIGHGGNAVIEVPKFPSIRFTVRPWDGEIWSWKGSPEALTARMNWEQMIGLEIVDQEIRFEAPYLLEYKTHAQEFTINFPSIGEVKGQLIRQQVSGTMLVHIAMYRDA